MSARMDVRGLLAIAVLSLACAPENGLPWLRDGGLPPGNDAPAVLPDAAAGPDTNTRTCDFAGAWELTYSNAVAMDRGSLPPGCVPTRDLIVVSWGAGNAVNVRFMDLEPQQSTCSSPPTPGTRDATATLIEATCALEAVWNISWCSSGEQQCERRKVYLRSEGAGPGSLTGQLTYNRCWCGGGAAGVPVTAKVTATRL